MEKKKHFLLHYFAESEQNEETKSRSSAGAGVKAERCRTAPSRCGKRYFFSSIFFLLNSAETLHEDLSFYKVDRILCAEPAMTAARMLLSFGGHQLQAYTCYSRSLVRGVPGPAGVTHKERDARQRERWRDGGGFLSSAI